MSVATAVQKRPAETTTGVSAAVVAILVATTHLSTPPATALVVVVGALPGFVTAIVSATRSTASGTLLVSLTPAVRELADKALQTGMKETTSSAQTTALTGVTEAVAPGSRCRRLSRGPQPPRKLGAALQSSRGLRYRRVVDNGRAC